MFYGRTVQFGSFSLTLTVSYFYYLLQTCRMYKPSWVYFWAISVGVVLTFTGHVNGTLE